MQKQKDSIFDSKNLNVTAFSNIFSLFDQRKKTHSSADNKGVFNFSIFVHKTGNGVEKWKRKKNEEIKIYLTWNSLQQFGE